jgi:hypothetical protein
MKAEDKICLATSHFRFFLDNVLIERLTMLLKNSKNASTKLGMNGKSPTVRSEALDERRVCQQNPQCDLTRPVSSVSIAPSSIKESF